MSQGSAPEDLAPLVEAVLVGEQIAVARLITLVERGGASARAALAALHPHSGRSYVLGVTGAPGAGKSTLVGQLVRRIRAVGSEVGVLAVDPTSPFTGGALLGDRIRMQEHATDRGVFIRSLASRGHLGGLSLSAPRAARILAASGKDWVIVETLGVGQVEVEVAAMADSTLVVVNPGWGDSVQAAKAGLLEVADVFVVNKGDRSGVAETVGDLRALLELTPETTGWRRRVVTTVATEGGGMDELWDAVLAHRRHLEASGEMTVRRAARSRQELRAVIEERMSERADRLCHGPRFESLAGEVASGVRDPYAAAAELLAEEG